MFSDISWSATPSTLPWLDFSGAETAIDTTGLFYDEVNENIQDVSSRGIGFDWEDMPSLYLIHPEEVIDLRDIGDQMIRSGYEKECCQAYCSVRHDVLDKRLVILGVEKLSIEEVQRMEWRWLDQGSLLLGNVQGMCGAVFEFWRGSAIGRRSADKLFAILDMYQTSCLQALFMEEDAGEMVCFEAKEVLDVLDESAIGNFVEFENAILGEASRKPVQNDEIHPLKCICYAPCEIASGL